MFSPFLLLVASTENDRAIEGDHRIKRLLLLHIFVGNRLGYASLNVGNYATAPIIRFRLGSFGERG